MMNTINRIKTIGFAASSALLLFASACSDNIDAELEPNQTERTLNVTHDGSDIPNHTLDLGAAPSSTVIEVASNTRWTVEISDCLGGWCDVDVINGSGNGSFTITVLDNMKDVRDCYVTVYKTDAQGNTEANGSIQIKVVQAVSDVRLSPSSLAPFAPELNNRQKFEIVSNVAWTLDVTYDSDNATRFITIIPDGSAMTENSDGTFAGNGAASFYIDVQNNRTAADRKAFINLRSLVATYSVEITQLKSQYTFDVSPSENRILPPEGGSIEFGVLSLSSWKVATAADWIVFSKTTGESSEARVGTTATILPNASGLERSAEIRFIPDDKSYQEQSVTVIQRGYDLSFYASRSDDTGVVPETGGAVGIELDSRFRWEITAPGWMNAASGSGNASAGYQNVAVAVDRNTTNDNRTGTITVTPLPTDFAGGITLDPSQFGIEPIRISVTQFGGREAAISVPWLVDGYTQTSATVKFNYYSPFYEIVEAGLEWREEGSSGWNTVNCEVTNPVDGIVSAPLTGLDPATRYEARGYVVDSTGRRITGSVSYPFTTSGQRPGAGDNPTPTL